MISIHAETIVKNSVNARVYILDNKKGVWLSENDFRYLINIETNYFFSQEIIKEKDMRISFLQEKNKISTELNIFYESKFNKMNTLTIQNNVLRITTEIMTISFVAVAAAFILYAVIPKTN